MGKRREFSEGGKEGAEEGEDMKEGEVSGEEDEVGEETVTGNRGA